MALEFVVDAFVGLDGSKYYGTLKNGVPSGLGTCIWPNQCHYDGEWRDGLMHGFGTYVWKTGQRYDGEWKDGRRDGIGIKTYADGSMYDGFWKAGKKHGLGVFRPAPEESSSRRHSNHMGGGGGWQPQQQQQQRLSGAGSPEGAPPPAADLAAESVFAQQQQQQQELAAASASSDAHELQQPAGAAAAAAPAGGGVCLQDLQELSSSLPTIEHQQQQQQEHVSAQPPLPQQQQQFVHKQQQQQQQRTAAKPHLVSPFLAAAAALNSETSIIGEPPRLPHGSWQQLPTDRPAAAGVTAAAAAAAGSASGVGASTAAVDDALASDATSAAATAAAGNSKPGEAATDSSGLVVPAASAQLGAAAAAAAPRKLFVREYSLGQLVREYPLTAEEIKMIFGFLWPKANKVRRHVQRVLRRGPRMQKKMGEVVYKGNPSYAIMANLQLGIRYSVGRGPWPPSHAGSWLGLGGLGAAVTAPWGSSGGCVGGGQQQQQQQQVAVQQAQQVDKGAQGGHRRQLSDALSGVVSGVLTAGDFQEKRTLYFPTDGSPITPAHPNTDFKWNDYAPRVFRRLRRSAGIDEADYMISLGGSQALRQLSSPGKSGSMFLLSEDERFLVKTMRKSEMKVLLDMLPAYTAHMEKHPQSLITRFFGLHKLRSAAGRSVRFVVMANIFVTDLQIHRRYDIKGSTEGRTVGAEARSKAAEGDPGVIFKDLDVDLRIVLEQGAHEQLMAQLAADAELLRTVGVMDYSLLLGVHYPARHFTRASLEAGPSFSLDGTLPHVSPQPGGTLPGSALGSFSEGQLNLSAGQDAAAAAAGGGPVPAFYSRAYTMSDDDVQPPPQQLQRSVVQLQAAQQQQQQQQQQGARQQQQQQQQSPMPVEVFGPWSAPAAVRLTAQSSVSSVGSERLALEQYSAAGAAAPGPGSSLGPSPQPPSLLQQAVLSAAGALDEGAAAQSRVSPSQAGSLQQQQQQSGRGTPWTSGGGGGGGGLGASQAAAAAAAAIAAAGAATAASGSGAGGTPGWSSTGGASAAAAAAAANTGTGGPGSGTTSGHGGAGGSSAAGGAGGAGGAAAHPQLLAMVNHPWAGSGAGARNWELFSGAAELEEQLGKVSERMQEMGFSEQRIKDVAELARLKILGSKLKKSATRKEPPSVVLQAMQQQRQVAEGGGGTTGGGAAAGAPSSLAAQLELLPAGGVPVMLTSPSGAGLVRHQTPTLSHLASLRGAFAGLGVPFEEDEEAVVTPMALGLPDPRAPVPTPPPAVPHVASLAYTTAAGLPLGQQLGINMLALAVPQHPQGGEDMPCGGQGQQQHAGGAAAAAARGPEEVVLCFGIIDILQDYSTRKVLERTIKGLTHDKAAISVAPPKAYAKRFLDFVTHKVFMAEAEYNEQRQLQQAPQAQQQFTQAVSLAGRRVSEASSIDADTAGGGGSGTGLLVGGAPGSLLLSPTTSWQQQQGAAAAAARQLAPIATGAGGAAAAAGATAGRALSHQPAAPGCGVQVVPGSPNTPLLSFDDAHMLAAGAADMNLGLLGSPDALSGPESSGAFPLSTNGTTGSSAADGTQMGEGAAAAAAGAGAGRCGYGFQGVGLEQQQLQQLLSAEDVSVSVPQASEGGDSSASNVAQQQQQGGGTGGVVPAEVLPAVVVELQQQQQGGVGKHKPAAVPAVTAGSNGTLAQQQHEQQRKGVSCGGLDAAAEGHQGGSSSPAEAEVFVVNGGAAQQQQQPGRGTQHLGSQHANLLAKLGL